MKYKVLLLGKGQSIINDFFLHMSSKLECMTTSLRFDDILCHIKYFSPDLIIYCMSDETDSSFKTLKSLRMDITDKQIKFALLGDSEQCNQFLNFVSDMADAVIKKPCTMQAITEQIEKLLENRKKPESTPSASQAFFASQTSFSSSSFMNEADAILDSIKDMDFSNISTGTNTAANDDSIIKEINLFDQPDNFGSKKHILVVDDNSGTLKLVKNYLSSDYEVATAISGKVALKFLEKKTTNLILLDYEMPEENGPEVLEKIRQNPKTSDIPVVFLTGVKERSKINEVLSMKPQGYLLKPIDMKRLSETIKKIIG